MPDKPQKNGKPWTAQEVDSLLALAGQGASAAMVSAELQRSIGAIQQKAQELGVTLVRSAHRPRGQRATVTIG